MADFEACGGDVEPGRFRPWRAAPIHSTNNVNNDDTFPFSYVLAFAIACTFADRDAVGDVRWDGDAKKKNLRRSWVSSDGAKLEGLVILLKLWDLRKSVGG